MVIKRKTFAFYHNIRYHEYKCVKYKHETIHKKVIAVKVKNNLRVLMAQHKMNIKDVHEKTGLSRTTISKMYNETSGTISFETIEKLCLLFDCEVHELLYLDKK